MNQTATALRRANDVRTARADLKRAVKSGEIAPLDALDALETDTGIEAWDLLRCIWRVGTPTAHQLCDRAGIAPNRNIGGASDRTNPLLPFELAALHQEVERWLRR